MLEYELSWFNRLLSVVDDDFKVEGIWWFFFFEVVYGGDVEIVKIFFVRGVFVVVEEYRGCLLLYIVVLMGYIIVMKFLLDVGFDVEY